MGSSSYQKYFQNFLSILLISFVFGLFGCSNGGGDTSSSSKNIISFKLSGKVQKGQYLDGIIIATKLEDNGSLDSTHISKAIISKDGEYVVDINWNGPTFLQAEGHYFDEYSNINSSQNIILEALIDVNSTQNININLLSSLESSRILELLKTDTNFSAVQILAKENLEQIFSHPKNISTTDLNMFDFNSSFTNANKNLLLLSALFLKVTQEDETFSSSLSARAPNRGGTKSLSLSKLKSDFSKNGQVDTVFKDKWEEIIEEDILVVSDIVSKNIDKEVIYVAPSEHWSKRLQLSVSRPQYIFDGSQLKKIIYDVSIPLANYVDRSIVYNLSYDTSDNSARAGYEYTDTSGNFSFTFTHNSAKIIIDVLSQTSETKIFNLNFTANTKGLSITNPRLEVEIFKNTISLASRPSILSLSLDSVDVDELSSSISPGSSVVFVGNSTSIVNLAISIEASTSRPAEYFANVYATASGQEPLKLAKVFMTTLGDVGGRVFYQGTDVNVLLDSVLKTFLQTAYDNNAEVKLFAEVVIDESSSITLSSYVLPQLVQISTSLSENVEISTFEYLEALDSSCNSTSQSRFDATTLYAKVNMYGLYSASYLNAPIGIEYDDVCVQMKYDSVKKEYGLTLESGEGILDADMHIEVYGNSLILSEPKVSNTSIVPKSIRMFLPEGHTLHKRDFFNNISARGENSFTFTPKKLGVSDDLSLATYTGEFPQESYLHGKNLPFYFKLNKVRLDANGLSLESLEREYVFAYSNANRNNTDRFKNPKSGSFSFHLKSNGISSNDLLFFDATSLKTQFPKAQTSLKAFSIKVDKSEIQTSSKNVSETYSTEYQQNCKNNECGSSAKYTSISFNTSNTRLYKDGSSVSTKTDEPVSIVWGEKGLSSVYKREHDKGVSIYVPGFILPTNDVTKVGEYLYGSVKSTSSKLYSYGSRTKQAKSGEYLYAGVNVGALLHSSDASTKTPDMSVVLGDDTTLTLTNTKDTKYYLRHSGITGVFNNTEGVIDTTLYGYDMKLKSFKFRQIANEIDEYTKIEGDVHVPGLGNFDVAFKSLAIDCSGNFRGGSINSEQSEILLETWQMNSKLINIEFKNRDGQVCSSKKTLWLGHLLKVAALKNKVQIGTFWDNTGSPRDSIVKADTYNQLDGHAIDFSKKRTEPVFINENGGYDIALKNISFNFTDSSVSSRQAWIESDAKMGLPFWGAQNMSIRMTNITPARRDFSVVTKEGELYKGNRERIQSNSNLAAEVRLHYDQNITRNIFNVIDFSLPAHYSAKNTIDVPSFYGTPYIKDLIVLKLNANIDSITPETTKISLGASADLKILKDPDIHIDFEDNESLARMDANLTRLFPSLDKPLQKSLGRYLELHNKIEKGINEKLSIDIEKTLYLGLKTTALLGDKDPYKKMADASAKLLNAIPSVLHKFNDKFYDELLKTFNENEAYTAEVAYKLRDIVTQYDSGLDELNRTIEYLKEEEDLQDDNSTLNTIYSNIYKYGLGTPENNCSWNNLLKQQVVTFEDWDKTKTITLGKNSFVGTTEDVVEVFRLMKDKKVPALIKNKMPPEIREQINDFEEYIHGEDLEGFVKAYDKSKDWIDNKFCKKLDKGLDIVEEINATLQMLDDNRHETIKTLETLQAVIKDSEFAVAVESIRDINEDSNFTMLRNHLVQAYEGNVTVNLIKLAKISKKIHRVTPDEYRKLTVYAVMQLKIIQELDEKYKELMQPYSEKAQGWVKKLFGFYDGFVSYIFTKVNEKVNKAIQKSATKFAKIPIDAAEIDGYAIVGVDEVHRIHVGAKFTFASDSNSTKDENSTEESNDAQGGSMGANPARAPSNSGGSFGDSSDDSKPKEKKSDEEDLEFIANLDIVNEAYEGSAGCKGSSESSNMRVSISTENIAMKMGKKRTLSVDYLELGVVLGKKDNSSESRLPELKGVFGAIISDEGMDFEKFKLYNMGLALGVGGSQQFLGAKVSAKLDAVQLGMSFLVGNVCNEKIIYSLIPESISDFITIPNNQFKGFLIYGEGQIPIYAYPANSELFSVGLRAKLGVWSLEGPPIVQGGLIGGGVFGYLLKTTISGNIMILRESVDGETRWGGDGWIAGSLGTSCDPATWQSFQDVIDEDAKLCITYGASFDVTKKYNEKKHKDKFKLTNIKTKPNFNLGGDE